MSLIMSVAPESCTFEWIVLSMDDFHRRGLISFGHRRQPLDWLRIVAVIVIIVEFVVDFTMTFVMDYDDRLLRQFGNIGRFMAGSSYRFFGAVDIAFKSMATAYLVNHLLSDYGFVQEVDHKLAAVAPRVYVSRHQMTRVVKLSRRVIRSFLWMIWGVSLPVDVYHVLVTYRDLSLIDLIPSILESLWVCTVPTFLITSFLGEYYLMVQYCVALVDKVSQNFKNMIKRNKTVAELDQCLADFEVVCEALNLAHDYIARLYLIFVMMMSILFPVILFNVMYVNVNLVFKSFMGMITGYYYLLMCFMSYIAGQVNWKIENSANLVYQELLLKNIWTKLFSIKHKVHYFNKK